MVDSKVPVPYGTIVGIGGQAGIGIAPVHGDIFIGCEAGYPYPYLRFPSGVPVGDFVLQFLSSFGDKAQVAPVGAKLRVAEPGIACPVGGVLR